MLVHSRLYVTIQQKQIIMTYTVKNRLGYDKIGLLYDSRSRLLDPYSDRMGAVSSWSQSIVGLTNLLHVPELPKEDTLICVVRKILLMYVFSSVSSTYYVCFQGGHEMVTKTFTKNNCLF